MDREETELRVLEKEYSLQDQKNSFTRMDIEEKRMALKLKKLSQSRKDLEESIKNTQAEIDELKKLLQGEE